MPYYGPRSKRTLAKVARTLPVQGKGEDQGRFYRCWNCGFVCDASRLSEDSGSDVSDAYLTEVAQKNTLGVMDGPNAAQAVLGIESPWFCYEVAQKCASDGTAAPIRYNMTTVSGSGCPLCGTKNWKGKKR